MCFCVIDDRDLGEGLRAARTPQDDLEARGWAANVQARLFGAAAPVCVGRYRVGRRLGTGGAGVVFAARDPALGRSVAIKMVRAGAVRGLSCGARLQLEARCLAKLSHENVASLYDIGEHGGRTFIAMELVEGPTLETWLRDRHTVAEVLAAFVQAGRGLAATHAVGLVHRDFKPDNVLLGGASGRVRLIDFGLARDLSATAPDTPVPVPPGHAFVASLVTPHGAVVGTPAYMAPEQRSGQPSDARSDQYSFCVALSEALLGVRPGPAEIAPRTLAVPLDAESVPDDVRAAIGRGLAQDPADRFRTMDDLLKQLQGTRGVLVSIWDRLAA